jgi:DNA-binding MarR family transcriptional regulator
MSELFELALSVKAITRELERLANEAMRPIGLTGAQADALLVIAAAEPMSLKELGELLIAESGHPSRLVDRLVAAGLVERRAAAEDRRRVELSLTAKGRRVARKARAARDGVMQIGAAMIGDHNVGDALALLRDVLRATPFQQLVHRRCEMY